MNSFELELCSFSELQMQELEPMEAPGWWTAAGVVAGVVVSGLVVYGSIAATIAIT